MYDATKLANHGRDTARAYKRFRLAEETLCEEINAAITMGIKPIKIAHDVLGRCASQEAKVDLMSSLIAMAKLGHIPKSVVEPFEKGIRPKRI